jgi:uncharacterized protein YciI
MQFAYVITPCRPTFLKDMTDAEAAKVDEHFAYLQRMLAAGELILAGRCDDATFGIVIFSASSPEVARARMENDPAVVAGVFTAELHPFRVALTRT